MTEVMKWLIVCQITTNLLLYLTILKFLGNLRRWKDELERWQSHLERMESQLDSEQSDV